MFPWVIIFTVFVEAPISCGGPRATAQFAPLISGRVYVSQSGQFSLQQSGSEICTGKRQLNFCLAGNVNYRSSVALAMR